MCRHLHGPFSKKLTTGSTKLKSSKYRIGFIAALALVALRLGVGWHFFKEGAKKFQTPNFTSSYFLNQAVGPLADFFHGQVPDRYGLERVNQENIRAQWKATVDKASSLYGLDDTQKKRLDAIHKNWNLTLDTFFREKGPDLQEYQLEVERLKKNKADRVMREVPYGQARIAQKRSELQGKMSGWLNETTMMHQQFRDDLVSVATNEQRSRGSLPIPGQSKSWVDIGVKFLVITVGICLVLGLFTRLASIAGAGFLASVIATQPPWVAGAAPTYYQSVEFLSLMVLAATGAGRFAGLDAIIAGLRNRCCPSDSGGSEI